MIIHIHFLWGGRSSVTIVVGVELDTLNGGREEGRSRTIMLSCISVEAGQKSTFISVYFAACNFRQFLFRRKRILILSPCSQISPKGDVWSLGCILYYMTYGKTPFQSITNQISKLHAIIDPSHQIDFPDVAEKDLLDVLKVGDRRDGVTCDSRQRVP